MPALIGPSELSLSLAVTANPDLITANGAAQSTIRVIARDAAGQPQPNVDIRVDTVTGGDVIVEIGQLSQHLIKTDSKGEATLTFTAPMAPNPGIDDTPPVTVRLLPVSTDFALQMPRYVVIRLVPPAVIVVPGAPIPDFSFLPATPAVNELVNFNAAASTDPDGIASYTWDWGDGETATKTTPAENHDFAAAGTYIVTLTVLDNTGQRSSKSKQVVVH
jgi:PKD repeat protein